jgi:ectoine hydroxylase-related dioxygenase (phytanoyl-CoA dioxygenase family)
VTAEHETSGNQSALTEEQVHDFHRDGYLAPVPALDPGETARFRSAVAELEELCGGSSQASALVQPQLFYAWAYELATYPVLLDAVELLIGRNILVHSAAIFSKGAHSRRQVDWHQDGCYWALPRPAVVSAWVALTDSTPENGCLRVIPGSHTRGVVPFQTNAFSDDAMLPSGVQVAADVDEGSAVDLVLRPGQASFHHEYTIHGSAANGSSTKRVGFAIRYIPPDVLQRDYAYEVLLARGRDDHHHYRVRSDRPTATVADALAAHRAYSEAAIQRWMDTHQGKYAR